MAGCIFRAENRFANVFPNVEVCPGDITDCEHIAAVCSGTIAALLSDTFPSRCEAAKIKAAGKLARRELGCYANDFNHLAACIATARAKFAAALAKAGACPDGGAPQDAVEANCVAPAVATDSFGVTQACPTTTSTMTTMTTSTTTTTPPRFVDNGDGTILDHTTALVWEKKSDDGSVHDKDNLFTWTAPGIAADGTAFTVLLAQLNNRCASNESVDCTAGGDAACAAVGGPCGFAGHRDWRLPDVNRDGGREELESLVDLAEPPPMTPGAMKAPCAAGCAVTDTSCSCTALPYYWAGTTYGANPAFAWAVGFGGGDVANGIKTDSNAVCAVRHGP